MNKNISLIVIFVFSAIFLVSIPYAQSSQISSFQEHGILLAINGGNVGNGTHEIIAFVARTWNIVFSVLGMNKWLHRHDFTYKKPSGIPHKLSLEKQNQFIKYYEELKDESIFLLIRLPPIRPPTSVIAGYAKVTGK